MHNGKEIKCATFDDPFFCKVDVWSAKSVKRIVCGPKYAIFSLEERQDWWLLLRAVATGGRGGGGDDGLGGVGDLRRRRRNLEAEGPDAPTPAGSSAARSGWGRTADGTDGEEDGARRGQRARRRCPWRGSSRGSFLRSPWRGSGQGRRRA